MVFINILVIDITLVLQVLSTSAVILKFELMYASVLENRLVDETICLLTIEMKLNTNLKECYSHSTVL